MKLLWLSLTVSKAGHAPDENEDAFVVASNRAVVCDGASEGWGSGAWARHLALAWKAAPPTPATFESWLIQARAGYTPAAPAVSWYAEEKQAAGAFSTILGFGLAKAKDGGVKYQAMAVGDTSLFHMRADKLLARFPVEKSKDFSNRPALIGSSGGEVEPEWFAGRAEPGDRFYLLSDALAEWFLRGAERGETPWQVLDAVTSAADAPAEFVHWVESRRAAKDLKNDDTTLVRVRISEE